MRFTKTSGKQDADTMRSLGLGKLLGKLKSERRHKSKNAKHVALMAKVDAPKGKDIKR